MKRRYQTGFALLALASGAGATEPLHTYVLLGNYQNHVSEASGITYNWDTDTFFTIGDEGEELVQITKTGGRIDSMAFDYNVSPREARGLDDAEGVAYLGNNTFMLADERDFHGRVTTYEAGALRTQQDLAPSSYYFTLYEGNANIGLEGVAYDPVDQAVWGIKETGPLSLFKMTGIPELTGNPASIVTVTQPIERRIITRWDSNPAEAPLGVSQASDIYALSASAAFPTGHPRRNNLLVLARNKSLILEINRSGTIQDILNVGNIGGQNTIEGMVMDKLGHLYLVAEKGTAKGGLFVLGPAPAGGFRVISHTVHPDGEAMTGDLTWNSVAGESYVIEFSPDLIEWSPASGPIIAEGPVTSGSTFPLPVVPGTGFFRVRGPSVP